MRKPLQITFYLMFLTTLLNGQQGQQIINKPVQTFDNLITLNIVGLDFHPNGKKFIVTTSKVVREYTINQPNNQNGRPIINFKNALININDIAYSPKGNFIATANRNWSATITNVENKREVKKLKGHCNAVNAVAFSNDGKWLATASDDLRAKIWDIDAEETKFNLIGHKGWITDIAFSPDSRYVVTVSFDGTIKVWDVNNGKLLKTLPNKHQGVINAVCVSPNNQWIATASDDNTAIIWNWQNNRVHTQLQGSCFDINDVAFSTKSDYLITGSDDGIARIWSVETGSEKANLIDHTNAITSVAVSNDGQHVVTGSTDKSIKLWQVNFNQDNPFQPENITWEAPFLDNIYRPYPTTQSELKVRLNIMTYSPISKSDLQLTDGLGNAISLDYNNHLNLVNDDSKETGRYNYKYIGKVRLTASGDYILSFQIDNENVRAYSKTVKVIYQPEKPTLHVLSIGPSYTDLLFTKKDAEDFAQLFRGQSSLYDDVNVHTLTGRDATASNIEAAIERLKVNYNDIIKPHDLVIIFFSGHGEPAGENNLYLRGYTDNKREPTHRDLVDFNKFREMKITLKCKTFIFLDACHSGLAENTAIDGIDGGIKDWFRYCDMETAPKGFQLREAQRKLLKSGNGWMLMNSSDGQELSYEYNGFQNGIFTEAILLGLGEYKADTNGNNLISIEELFNYIKTVTPNLCQEANQNNQTPGLDNGLDDLEFFMY
ncbi:MAG: caspase family protein [Saprospiraceae bacterium]